MTRHLNSCWLPAALVSAGLMLSTAAQAQRGSEAGMSGCPDGTKDGVMAAQPIPTPGGGCDNTVYSSDEYRGGKRGIRPAAPPAAAKTDKGEPAPAAKKKSRDKSE